MKNNLRINRGFLLVEALVAIGLFAATITAAFLLFFGGQSLSVDGLNAEQALDYTQEGMEATRSIRDRDWSMLTPGNHGLNFNAGQWAFSGVSDNKDIFTRQVIITDIDLNTKQASTTVTWQVDPQRPQKIELIEILTNWRNAVPPASGVCSGDTPTGNWQNPQSLGSGDLGAGNEGTDIAVKLPYVYVSGVASSAAKPDIFVFDVNNPVSPLLIASLNIGAKGISALYIKDDYLYAASENDSKEFIVFDISTPANIFEAASLNLTGTDDAISIHGSGNAVYLGRKESSQPELTVINITTPTSPSIAASFEVVDDVNDLIASGNRLYIVTEESNNDLRIYDITAPLLPSQLISYNMTQGGELISIAYQANGNLFAGDHSNQFFVLGATNTSQIYVRDSLTVGGGVNDIACVANNLAFLATTNTTKEFFIVNTANPDNISEYSFLNFPNFGTGIEFVSNKVFMSVKSNNALRIIGPGP